MKNPNFLRRLALLSIVSSALWGAGTFVPTSAQNLRTHSAPRSAQGARLPPSVRQMMPRGNLSLRLFRLAPAPRQTSYLVHLWTAPRRKPQFWAGTEYKPNPYKGKITRAEVEAQSVEGEGKLEMFNSPFVFDIFTDEKVPKYQASLVYGGKVAPDNISLRYIDSKIKSGLMFQIDESVRYEYRSRNTFYVFEYGLDRDPRIDTFYGYHGYGGGAQYHFRRAADGTFEVVKVMYFKGAPPTTDILIWNGERFVEKSQKPRS